MPINRKLASLPTPIPASGLFSAICSGLGGHSFALLILLIVLPGSAFRPMYDYRYNIKPEVFVADESELYGTFQTHWQADGSFQGGFKFGINDRFEIGSRIYMNTENQVANRFVLLDLGGKMALDASSALQIDGLLGINTTRGGAIMVGYSTLRTYTSRFSALYETRLGFLDEVTGGDWMSVQTGAYSQFRVAPPLLLRIGLMASSDLREPIDRFGISLLPGLMVGITENLRVLGECGVDIIGGNGVRLSISAIGNF